MATYNINDGQPTNLVVGDIVICPYSGSIKELTIPRGQFKLECWGAKGGHISEATSWGHGGYSSGLLNIKESKTLYLVSGEKGITFSSSVSGDIVGSYNGGGAISNKKSIRYSCGGGGATHIAYRSGLLESLSEYRKDILMVAGGAGGNGHTTHYDQYVVGGSGGGFTGGDGDLSPGDASKKGTGGTQTEGGTGRESGIFGKGGLCRATYDQGAGSGGGGFYGGGGGTSSGSAVGGYGYGSGGGGSGFVNSAILQGSLTAQETISSNPDIEENGYIRITFLTDVLTTNYYINDVNLDDICESLGSFNGNLLGDNYGLKNKYAKLLYGESAVKGHYQENGVDLDIALLGTRPTNTKFAELTSPGTYTISRTDSALTIGSLTFGSSSFRGNMIPKYIGVMFCGGGGGGGAANGDTNAHGGGGGSISLCILNISLQEYSIAIGSGGSGGTGGTGAGNKHKGGTGGESSISINNTKFITCSGGIGGHLKEVEDRGGAGGIISPKATGLITTGLYQIAYTDGAEGQNNCNISGNIGHGETVCSIINSANGGKTPSGTGAGGGGGGASIGNAPDGGYSHAGYDGEKGSGGSGGSWAWFNGRAGGVGGAGCAYFYY